MRKHKRSKQPKSTGFGRCTRAEHLERTLRGLDWHEDVRLADLARVMTKQAKDQDDDRKSDHG